MRAIATWGLCLALTLVAAGLRAQEPAAPVKPQDQIALQFAAWIDYIWERAPKEGRVNLRFAFRRDGRPFEGKISSETQFAFTAVGAENVDVNQAFNPNPNGRWIFEDLAPGEYLITLQGRGPFAGWKWRQRVRVAAGTAPLIEVELDP